ncbi:MAG: tRNA (N6-threonylcarbamoyladenosine(37)-N6)-methyltransferase TrmO [Candidatus Bathyarchaeum tardum]|nr:MAG: tRNA (N6-threonylcarbamoyladenosine(37)-N6)-methyltransferase TrmO [Candidatus Bathyarchaeum tardum]
MDKIVYKPLGVVYSPFEKPQDVPIQSAAAKGVKGTIQIHQDYINGLKDLDGFSHLILIYHFHLAKPYSLQVKPFLDQKLHGLFSTRAPSRPNPIGISVVRLEKIEKNILHIQDVDIVNKTPLLDIKPYVPSFDQRNTEKIGWLTKNINKLSSTRDDGRFAKNPQQK